MDCPKDIAVVGAGYWGKNLVHNFYKLGRLKTICDTSPQRQEEFADKYPQIKIESSFDQVLKDTEIRGVVIATPAETHFALAKIALECNKDVFVEKPLCLNPEEGQQLCHISQQKNKILMVGHLLHYHPAIKKIKEMVLKGKVGKIHHIYSNRLNLGIFRSEENVMWSFAPHDISVILSFINSLPKRVMAVGTDALRKNLYDTVHLKMELEENLYGSIFVSWLHPFKEQRMVIAGDRGILVFEDTKKEDKLLYYSEPVQWDGTKPYQNRKEPQVIAIDDAEPLKEECKSFLKAVDKRIQPLTNGEEGLRVLKVLCAAQHSLEKKEEWIKLEEIDKHYFAHPTAVIDEGCKIGADTKIWHFSHIMSGAEVGENCNIGQNVVISPGVKLSKNVKIQNNVSVYTGVICEDDVFLGPSMVFTNIKKPRSCMNRRDQYVSTLVKKGATIGANATVVCGITIGEYALIGAGAVVTKNVPAHAVVYGNPAKVKGWVCKCGNAMVKGKQVKLECNKCGFNSNYIDALKTPNLK